jgi:hypothetical protein
MIAIAQMSKRRFKNKTIINVPREVVGSTTLFP